MNNNYALVIIDVQVELFQNFVNPLYKADGLIKNIKSLIEKARVSKTPVIYVQHTESDEESMGKGKPGWQIHQEVRPLKEDTVVLKYTPDSFHNTNLHEILSSKNIDKIVIAGLQTEYCIDTTCRRAYILGYNTILVKDAHSTYDNGTLTASQIIEHHNRVIGSWFAKVIPSDEINFS